ncbi:MAG TPA: type II secretion system protein [Syntrophorhabdaceae bacterium]|nr:type II secretion system protein [Syntrophorhabdaceae bacterium]HQM81777.1 type II secretion system protein [Syntrophorhabdaceae bacterium]
MSQFKKIFSPRPSHLASRTSGLFSLFFHNMERRTLNIELSRKGFTALELIIVIMVLTVLAASVIIKNPFSIQDYSAIAADQLIADIQYVQMRAMGVGSSYNLYFTIGSNSYNIRDASNNVIEQKNLPGNITVTSTTLPDNKLAFNTLGEPTFGTTDKTISLSGSATPITIYAITGKVE